MNRKIVDRFMTPQLATEITPGSQVESGTLQQLHQIRLAQLPFVKEDDRQSDRMWADFQRSFQQARSWSVVFRDHEGVPQGFWFAVWDLFEHAGVRALVIRVDYTYMNQGWRGNSALIFSGLRVIGRVKARAPWLPLYWSGICFPNSFIRVADSLGAPWTLADANLPEFERALLEYVGQSAGGSRWDPASGLVNYSDHHPPKLSPRTLDIPRLRKLFERYDSINPAWREGKVIPIICPVGLRNILRAGQHSLRRLLRNS